ncbi:hypothetical protein HBB16_03400 [Pseudonocardia sp. MCCB 268]|nr:hypothetical protein [Pseudonocardia cytotoxica]
MAFYIAAIIRRINTYDAVVAFAASRRRFGLGLATSCWSSTSFRLAYTLSCHSCCSSGRRPAHHFSRRHPVCATGCGPG